MVFFGLIPDAKYAAVTSKVLLSNSFGSCLIVIACKSTIQNVNFRLVEPLKIFFSYIYLNLNNLKFEKIKILKKFNNKK